MLKIASVSGASLRFLGLRFLRPCWGSLRRSPRPHSREEVLAFGARNLTCSHDLIGTLAFRSQFPLQATLIQFLDPTPYMKSGGLTNCGYFCILCPHPIYVHEPFVIS